MSQNGNKKGKFGIFVIAILVCGFFSYAFYFSRAAESDSVDFGSSQKKIVIWENGLEFSVLTDTKTVGEFLAQAKINLKEQDAVFPARDEKIFAGTKIILHRAKKLKILEGGKKIEAYSTQNTVEEALWENKEIVLGEDDITVPSRESFIKDGMEIKVTHVLVKEETKNEPIDFKTITNEDDKMSWREKKVTQKGEKGNREVRYRIVYYDGKEISRKILEKNVTKDPVEEIVTQGTFVKIGKTHTGAASWYAWTGTMAAANPWLPMGSYVKVTNVDNGKSVIVKINDRGPFGPGRIIDLDKVAFAKIASLGAGVVNVKMEVITN